MNNDLVNGFAREVHSRAESLIESEIWCNDSGFIAALLERDFTGQFHPEQIANLFDTSQDAMEEFLISEGQIPKNWDLLDVHEMRLIADKCGFEPPINEIYEWWRISNYLAERLLQIGQPILCNDYGSWWGRCCTGQAISMDGTIQSMLNEGRSR